MEPGHDHNKEGCLSTVTRLPANLVALCAADCDDTARFSAQHWETLFASEYPDGACLCSKHMARDLVRMRLADVQDVKANLDALLEGGEWCIPPSKKGGGQ